MCKLPFSVLSSFNVLSIHISRFWRENYQIRFMVRLWFRRGAGHFFPALGNVTAIQRRLHHRWILTLKAVRTRDSWTARWTAVKTWFRDPPEKDNIGSLPAKQLNLFRAPRQQRFRFHAVHRIRRGPHHRPFVPLAVTKSKIKIGLYGALHIVKRFYTTIILFNNLI